MEVWKVVLWRDGGEPQLRHALPRGAEWMDVQYQGPDLVAWALVDPELPTVDRLLQIAGTGHYVSGRTDVVYLGTAQHPEVPFVVHVFEVEGA